MITPSLGAHTGSFIDYRKDPNLLFVHISSPYAPALILLPST